MISTNIEQITACNVKFIIMGVIIAQAIVGDLPKKNVNQI
jgi:hypothetical protein